MYDIFIINVKNLRIISRQSRGGGRLLIGFSHIFLCAILLIYPAFYAYAIEAGRKTDDYTKVGISTKQKVAVEYQLIWGQEIMKEEHPLIIELVHSDAFQRLKDVDQSGPITYFGEMKFFKKYGHRGPMPRFSRYDHSLAVMSLVKQALDIKDLRKANKKQLISVVAALLHDASHTAFSHVGDHFFAELGVNKSTQQCYQDDIHLVYLRHFGVEKILQKYGIELDQISPEKHTILKAAKGALSADKIQYITHTAVILKIFDQAMAKAIINDLIYDKATGEWYFKTEKLAKVFGEASIILTKNIYAAPDNYTFYQYFTQALMEGVKSNTLTLDMFKYGTDSEILQKLENSTNLLIKHYLKKLEDIDAIFEVVNNCDLADIKIDKLTFRGVDPKVKINQSVVELSKIDNDFRKHILELQNWCNNGYGIKFHKQEVQTIQTLKKQVPTQKAA
jgi:HD superfamily phosphohydrolase